MLNVTDSSSRIKFLEKVSPELFCFAALGQLDFNCKFGQNVDEAKLICMLFASGTSPKETTLSEGPYLH